MMYIIYDVEIYPDVLHITFMAEESSDVQLIWSLTWYDNMDEREALENSETLKAILSQDAIFVGYNNKHFDDKVLKFVASLDYDIHGNIYRIYEFANLVIENAYWWKVYRNIPGLDVYNGSALHGFRSIDLMKLHRLFVGLKTIAVRLHAEDIEELPFEPGTRITHDHNNIRKLEEYCLKDCISTEKLFKASEKELKTREEFVKIYPFVYDDNLKHLSYSRSVLSKMVVEQWIADLGIDRALLFKVIDKQHEFPILGRQITSFEDCEFQTEKGAEILNQFDKAIFKLSDGKINFKHQITFDKNIYTFGTGGLHTKDDAMCIYSNEETVVVAADIASYYPNLIRNYKLLNPLIVDIIKDFSQTIDIRINAKHTGLNSLNETLKIVINAFSGLLGSPDSVLYHKLSHLKMTIGGQLLQFRLVELLTLIGVKVISVNTDGVIFSCAREELDTVRKEALKWEKRYNFELDFDACKLYAMTATNNYMYVTDKGKTKGVGIFDNKPSLYKAGSLNIVSIALRNYFEKNLELEETIYKHDNIHDFLLNQTVGRGFECYWTYNEKPIQKLQRANRWFWTFDDDYKIMKFDDNRKIKIGNSDGAYVANSIASVQNWQELIDYEKYVVESGTILQTMLNNKF